MGAAAETGVVTVERVASGETLSVRAYMASGEWTASPLARLLRLRSGSMFAPVRLPAPDPVLHMSPRAQGRCGRCPPGSGAMFDLSVVSVLLPQLQIWNRCLPWYPTAASVGTGGDGLGHRSPNAVGMHVSVACMCPGSTCIDHAVWTIPGRRSEVACRVVLYVAAWVLTPAQGPGLEGCCVCGDAAAAEPRTVTSPYGHESGHESVCAGAPSRPRGGHRVDGAAGRAAAPPHAPPRAGLRAACCGEVPGRTGRRRRRRTLAGGSTRHCRRSRYGNGRRRSGHSRPAACSTRRTCITCLTGNT